VRRRQRDQLEQRPAAEEVEVAGVRVMVFDKFVPRVPAARPRPVDARETARVKRRAILRALALADHALVHDHQDDEEDHRDQRAEDAPEREQHRHADRHQARDRQRPLAAGQLVRRRLSCGEAFGVQFARRLHRAPFNHERSATLSPWLT
jgi:hypothetical protein